MKNINISQKLTNLPKAARIAIAVTPTVIFLVAFFFLVISPKSKQVEKLNLEIDKQKKEIAKSQSMVARLEELKIENERLKRNLLMLQEQLPEEGEISSLLKQIYGLGEEAGLQIRSWRPASPRMHQSGIVYEVPVNVALSGSYHDLGRFFASLTTLERIVNVNNINLGGGGTAPGKTVTLGITLSAVTFTAVSEGGIAQ